MSDFDAICRKLENLDPETLTEYFNQKSIDVISALMEMSSDGKKVIDMYLQFILATVAADGKLAPEEYVLIKAMFDRAAGKDVPYDEAVEIFNEMGLDQPDGLKNVVDTMVDVLGMVDEQLKDDILFLCLLVCAVDGEISQTEKDWIRQLVEPVETERSPMQIIDDLLTKAGTFILATTDGGQPRMRVLGLKIPMDERIYFAVGTFKDVYKQLRADPRCEILASVGTDFLRWDGKAEFSDDPRLPLAAGAAMPQIAELYAKNGWTLGFFTLAGGNAEIVSVTGEKTRIF